MNAKKCKAMNKVFGFYQARRMRRDIRRRYSREAKAEHNWAGLKTHAAELRQKNDPLTKSMMP